MTSSGGRGVEIVVEHEPGRFFARVVPTCPYTRRWVARHPELATLVAERAAR